MFTLEVRDTSDLSVQHPLFPLCVCFEIVPYNPHRSCHPLLSASSAKIPIFICSEPLLHTIFVRSFPLICFRKFSTFLSIFRSDENWWRQPRNFGRPLCLFCIRFLFIGQWNRAFSQLNKNSTYIPNTIQMKHDTPFPSSCLLPLREVLDTSE